MDQHSLYVQNKNESVASEVSSRSDAPLEKLKKFLSYLISTVFFLVGVCVIFGMFIPGYAPKQFRITLGVVLILWAIYRFVLARTKIREDQDD